MTKKRKDVIKMLVVINKLKRCITIVLAVFIPSSLFYQTACISFTKIVKKHYDLSLIFIYNHSK